MIYANRPPSVISYTNPTELVACGIRVSVDSLSAAVLDGAASSSFSALYSPSPTGPCLPGFPSPRLNTAPPAVQTCIPGRAHRNIGYESQSSPVSPVSPVYCPPSYRQLASFGLSLRGDDVCSDVCSGSRSLLAASTIPQVVVITESIASSSALTDALRYECRHPVTRH